MSLRLKSARLSRFEFVCVGVGVAEFAGVASGAPATGAGRGPAGDVDPSVCAVHALFSPLFLILFGAK